MVRWGRIGYIKNADSPNLQNFENERTISMDLKKFLTWENAGKVAAAYAALKYLREDPLPTKIHPSDCGGKVGEYNASQRAREMQDW